MNGAFRTVAALRRRGVLRFCLVAFAGSLLLAASAWVRVPMWPVPMTMQTCAVLLIGATAGARLGLAAVAAYLGEAALGLPVLAGGAPLLPFGPTAGYLLGFLAAAAALGAAADRGWTRRPLPLVAALLAAEALIYLPGLAWLQLGYLHQTQATLAAGLLPFLPGEAAKFLLAALVIGTGQRRAAGRG